MMWDPWRGCHKYSEGCRFCYIHKGDYKRNVDTNIIEKTAKFYAPIEKFKNGNLKIKPNQMVFLCFSSDFFLEDADIWRDECWKMMKERSDLHFLFLTKRITRFYDVIPNDWGDGYDNVTISCTIENQKNADIRLKLFSQIPAKHKNIVCQPLIEKITIGKYLEGIEHVIVGGESDFNARILDYDWVLSIREECVKSNVKFTFRQCGTNFLKDGRLYKIPTKLLMSQAKKANINT